MKKGIAAATDVVSERWHVQCMFFRVDSVMHLFLREELICFFKEDGEEKGRNSLRKMWCRQTSLGEVCEIFVVKGSRAYHRATIYICTRILVAVCLFGAPTVIPVELNKLSLFGTKMVTLFGRWNKSLLFGKRLSGG